ncbi:MAG: LysR family transcriptional regulator [Lautropia sp.]
MDDLNRLATFAEVVRCGSMSAAARYLGISPSAVSQQVRGLEAEYRVKLLHRTTRKITLTATGSRFAVHCRAMLEAAARARSQLQRDRQVPDGELRITAPIGFARFIGPALAPLLTEHPGLWLDLQASDQWLDLVEARIDLAIRVGELPDSDWVAQPLFRFERRLCAAPAYLAGDSVPTNPEALADRHWIGFGPVGAPRPIELVNQAGELRAVEVRHRCSGNSMVTLRELCVAGLGIANLVVAEAREDLDAGRLVPLLDGWRLPPLKVWAVTPGRDRRPARVRLAIEALREHMMAMAGVQA